ncbi:MAG TPA: hypothetical protein VJ852_11225 [Gemmatimonadaceae bacterium]|nr:hypothetical protein [Gemmatimonadaceae bacterium]
MRRPTPHLLVPRGSVFGESPKGHDDKDKHNQNHGQRGIPE